MNELSLFSGSGGGLLGTKLLGWNHIGYVEWDEYCQQVIAQRIKDGYLDEAPIFSDIDTFISEGYARQYKGMVDVVSGGFPCQTFSVAGNRDPSESRNKWPSTMEVIREIEPSICYFENVPGLLSATMDDSAGRSIHYFGEILRDLAEARYSVKWGVLGASDVGAYHKRERLWIVANANELTNG